ncbi:MAG: type II secretion system F family protein, partial [Oscillospiraceae bacterium]
MKKLSNLEISAFCNQIKMLIDAGISIQEGASIMLEDAKDKDEALIMQTIYDSCENGERFSIAIKKCNVFPKYMVDMIAVGEYSGTLDVVMGELAKYFQNEYDTKQNIKNAVRYPCIMIVMMISVILVLIIKIMPMFSQVFAQLGTTLSGAALSVIQFGKILSKYSLVFAVITVLIIAFFIFCNTTNVGRKIMQLILQNCFITKKIHIKTSKTRFIFALSLMLSSGVDAEESLEKVKPLINNKTVLRNIETCQGLISNGESFESALSKAKLFDGVYSKMISIGFKTGKVDLVMQSVSAQ